MSVVASTQAVTRPTRTVAWLSLLPFPMWVCCFILLFGFGVLGRENVNDLSHAEQASYYQQFPAGEVAAWAFMVMGVVALLLAGIAVFRVVQGSRSPLAGAARVLAVVATAAALFTGLQLLWLLGGDPERLPGWVEVPTTVDLILTTAIYAALSLALGLAALALKQDGVLGGAGKALGITGIVLSVITLGVPVPMFHAILLFSLGTVLLRTAADRRN